MSRFRVLVTAIGLLAAIQPALAQSKSTPAETLRERATVRYKGLPQENAEAIANIADTVSRFYSEEFGLKTPERIKIVADLARNNRAGILATAPDEITLKLNRTDQLKSPNKSNVYQVYAIAYEIAELARKNTIGDAKWMTSGAADGLSFYLASEAVDKLNGVYNRKLWPDAFDYSGEGINRLKQVIRNRNAPDMVQAAGFWFDLANTLGKSGIGGVLNALNKADAEKLNINSALNGLTGASDARGKSKVERWFKKFEKTLLVGKQGSSQSKASVKLANDPITVKYDDDKGTVVDVTSGESPAVFYQNPAGVWYLTEVQFHGMYDSKSPRTAMPTLWLCDRNMKPIASWPLTAVTLRGDSPRWRTVKLKPTLVPAEFAICIEPPAALADSTATRPRKNGPTKTDENVATTQPVEIAPQLTGLKISVDDSSKGHSAWATPGKSARPFEQGDWMIRVKLDTARTANPLFWRP